ncbi:class II aldolase/adducin family protein [Actinoalloteichus hymeniacidonis]|uniref:Ribulose-5-phosphate 4-epimerase-like epimerase or aldolase n=1 Tax=Actinoalloteichus hymeniacidonis TaxID=340345 RepID=A0AAC9HS53_9PSEU|nr:class II aldolase/adducin family protein [Actinoalloteichus hymeniacidonis]AOS63966.1 ribulose-5-phosphate 4-epimerase-like epimerase or aldolase [Actinoalloteichus hymeniacidonis]MBB5907976.1 L-fuculose-phosphate aldolase [Actinoalloteichus hymeniacidonis]
MSEGNKKPAGTTTNPLAAQAAIGSRALSLGGHDDFNQGQISCRRPQSSTFLIKGAMTGFDEATPQDFVVGDLDPTAEVDRLAPPEIPLHQAVYESRPDINCVVHSHAPAALVFGALNDDLMPLGHEGALLMGEVHRFTLTSNTVLDIEVGRAIATSLGAGIGVFLVNHGSVVVGKSVRHAVIFALMLERACRLQLDAIATGRDLTTSSALDVSAKRDYIFADLSVRAYWEHTRRRVLRSVPESRDW